MGRKATVEKLPEDQFDYLIRLILAGRTDREIVASFKSSFNVDLPKSSLNRWRNIAGNELAERYRLKRFQVRSFVEDLKKEGIEVEGDKYTQIIQSLEDHLLTAERDLIDQNPIRLLSARQEEERLRIKREELELKRQVLDFEREKHKNAVDRIKLGAETLQDFIEYAGSDGSVIKVLAAHLKPFGEFLKTKYAATEAATN
jgi:hypothetical protein